MPTGNPDNMRPDEPGPFSSQMRRIWIWVQSLWEPSPIAKDEPSIAKRWLLQLVAKLNGSANEQRLLAKRAQQVYNDLHPIAIEERYGLMRARTAPPK
jgi:hypothetical protein